MKTAEGVALMLRRNGTLWHCKVVLGAKFVESREGIYPGQTVRYEKTWISGRLRNVVAIDHGQGRIYSPVFVEAGMTPEEASALVSGERA